MERKLYLELGCK